jgi:HAD superfamily hydrolase (TIGR01549 family)
MDRVKAVVLDLFNTLVKWEPSRLPTIDYRGRDTRTTVPWLVPKLKDAIDGAFDLDTWLEAYHEVTAEIAEEREREEIEITCHERFRRTLARMKLLAAIDPGELAEQLTRLHMAGIRSVTYAPAENCEAVRRIAKRFRLGLLSNFDDSRTGREIVSDSGVGDLFESIVISADVGLRKPNPAIFRRMLEMLKLDAPEVLFVGDTAREDVLGACRAAMPVVWISDGNAALPEGIPQPNYTITKLPELCDLLDV